MTKETSIVNLLFSAALAALFCLCSCTEKQHTTDPEPENLPIGFRPMSQAVWVKSSPLSEFHDDFGVWGIARELINTPYILWERNSFMKVTKPDNSEVYVPDEDAYWLNGYEYTFLAVAPYTNSGVTPTFTLADATATPPTKDAVSFTYNLGDKYNLRNTSNNSKDHLEFDLMAAVAKSGKIGAVKPTSQDLTFWHLFTKININVKFVDASGNERAGVGTVSEMRLKNVDTEGFYELSFNDGNALAVACTSNHTSAQRNLTFSSGTETLHIIPQVISDFELYLDFTLDGASYRDFKINLAVTNNPTEYKYNDQYNWNISISPKAAIGFMVTVSPWAEEKVGDDNVIL